MTATMIPSLTPGSNEWRAQRMGGLGGSDIAAVLGLSPWESRFSLWHHKAGIHTRPDEDNPQMEWGRRLEPLVLQKWEELHPDTPIARGTAWRNDQRPWQLAAPDGLDSKGLIVEAKTSRDAVGWGDPGTDEIPVYYRAQVMHYMDCLDVPIAHVCVLIGGSDYREYLVDYDRDEAMFIREQAEAFLADVAQGNRPPIDGADATYQVIKQMHEEIDGSTFEVPTDLVRDIDIARDVLAASEHDVARLRATLADLMGTAKYAESDGRRIADRRSKNGGAPYVQWARQVNSGTIGSAA